MKAPSPTSAPAPTTSARSCSGARRDRRSAAGRDPRRGPHRRTGHRQAGQGHGHPPRHRGGTGSATRRGVRRRARCRAGDGLLRCRAGRPRGRGGLQPPSERAARAVEPRRGRGRQARALGEAVRVHGRGGRGGPRCRKEGRRHGGGGFPLPVPPGHAATVRAARRRRAGRTPAGRRVYRDARARRRRPALVVRSRRRRADGPRVLRTARPSGARPLGRRRARTGRRPREGTGRRTRRGRVAGGRPPVRVRGKRFDAMQHGPLALRDDVAGEGLPWRGDGHGLRPAPQGRPRDRPDRRRNDDRAPRRPLVLHLPARGAHPGAARRGPDADRPGRRRGHRRAHRPVLPRSGASSAPARDPRARLEARKELTIMSDPELEPLPAGVLETLRKVSTSTIATQLYKRGFRQPQLLGVTPLSEIADGFVGEAFTMRFIPMREDVDGLDPYRSGNTLQWEAFEALQPGQVLVVDSYRTATAASGGDMLMTRAWKRGAAAVVTDGGLRDGHVLAKLPFPTYASQVTITTRAAQHHVADLNVPIGCAGVAVYPGDVLVGDRDGVLVIPRHLVAEIAEQGYEQEQLEAYVSTKIHAGEPLWGNYPPGEELKAEYKASLAAGDQDPA